MATPFVAGIAGSSGSGKTFFLRSFLRHFETKQITLVSQDEYYIPANTSTREENMRYNFDVPTAIDRETFYKDIGALLKGQTVYKEAYTFNNPNCKPQILEIKPAPIVLIEGLFIYYYSEINALLDYRIFLDAAEDIALKRRIRRDFVERGYEKQEVLYKWKHHVMPAFNQYLLPFRERCDTVIHNHKDDHQIIEQASLAISEEIRQRVLR